MVRWRLRHKLVVAIAALLPLAVLPALLSRSVDPIARAAAAAVGRLGGMELTWSDSSERPGLDANEHPSEGEALAAAPLGTRGAPDARAALRFGALAQGRKRPGSLVARRASRRIYLGPDAMRRVVPASGRPVAVWIDRTADHPAGIVISRPGALAGAILPGDVLFEAEGTTLTSFEQVISIVAARYGQGARFVSGKLFRAGETWSVTVEPGWVMNPGSAGH